VPTARTRLARVRRVHFDYLNYPTNGTFSLLRQDSTKLRPSRVGNTLGKTRVLHHAFYIELFHRNQTKLIDQLPCQLMNKIMTTISDTLVNARNNLTGSLPSSTALRLFRQFSLRSGKGFFVVAKESRIVHKGAVRQSRELLQTDVDTDGTDGFRRFW